MSDKEVQQAAKAKLKALFEAVSEEIGRNPAFASKIANIFILDNNPSERKTTVKAKEEISFNHVTILQERGIESLRSELDKFNNEQLSRMSVKFKIFANLKESKKYDRNGLIDSIVKHAEQRLNVGSVFLRN